MSLLRSPLCFISQSSQEQENKIYTEGCVDAGDKWLSSNLVPVAGALVAVALVQVRVCTSHQILTLICCWLPPCL